MSTTLISYFQCFSAVLDKYPKSDHESEPKTTHTTIYPTVPKPSSTRCASALYDTSIPAISHTIIIEPSSRFKKEHLVQKGSNCIVSKVLDVTTQQQVALKKIKLPFLYHVEKEYEIQKSLGQHPHIAHMKDMIKDYGKKEIYLVMELCDGGDLVDIIAKQSKGICTIEFVKYAVQLADGLAHMHSHNIVHRDIKGDNVCTSKVDGSVKYVDFGEAQYTKERISVYLKGTLPYIAPELHVAHEEFIKSGGAGIVNNIDLKQADVWSLGITFYSMLTCRLPFKSATKADKLFSIYSNDMSALGPKEKWENMSYDVQILIRNMCNIDAQKRWTIFQVKDYLSEWSSCTVSM
eukprot:CFRG4347T1